MNTQQNPLIVSVGIVAHNHVNYIARAIESVLHQKVSFAIDLIIFDDASSDGTAEIIEKYQKDYPDIIRIFLQKEKKGQVAIARELASEMKGKYSAWLDADDFWTYHGKLQCQIDFLEQNSDYTACFHDAMIKSSVATEPNALPTAIQQAHDKYRYYSQFNTYSPDFYPHNLLRRNIIPTASLVFRNRDFMPFFNSFHLPPYSFSWALQLFIIRQSRFYYFNRCWSVYLDHTEGFSKKQSADSFSLNNVRILKSLLKDNYYKRFKNKIYLSIAAEYDCIIYQPSDGKYVREYARKSQAAYFKAWWWSAIYYLMETIHSLFVSKK
ncbi:MAG: hypothetical protein CVU05_04415 [Bacteroidetes bacterium HGW-Bacteroidetes-21]|jgi:glycosyltransferase involved in cell wall biosynthesis|nr:MAG: hypothetical protein CVU05_04415 [Bacteroidetes bacterium HGW-Bacteroidetes-21]